MQKNEKKVLQGFPNKSRDKLKQRVKSFYDILTGIHGADKLILKAIKLEALKLMRSKQIEKRVLGLQKIILEDPTLEKVPSILELPSILDQLRSRPRSICPTFTGRILEQKISRKLQERHEDISMK